MRYGAADFTSVRKLAMSDVQFHASERKVVIPVSVVLQRKLNNDSPWGLPQWSAYAIICEKQAGVDAGRVLIHDDGVHIRYLWTGLSVHLYKDGNEGYWYNLLSDKPYLFVVCDGNQGDMDIEPAFVTANQDEATGDMEAERIVLEIGMPDEMCSVVERYVVSHYVPEIKKKRKRKDWLSESEYVKKTATRH